jgi:transposase InsO family protein
LFKKDVSFRWGQKEQEAFDALKVAFTTSKFLQHPDEDKPFIVECDASDYGIGGVLSQYNDKGDLKPVAFYSRQMNPAERNYEIYDKELLAVHECFKEWRHFLQGGKYQVTVLTDHKNLQYFMTTKQLTRRQARWALFFGEFDFVLTHRPGSRNGKADILSRRPDYVVKDDTANFIQLIKPEQVIDSVVINAIHSETLHLDIIPEDDWPLIIADYLLSDNWMDNVPEHILSTCKKELKHFRIKDDKLVRILDDARTTVPYLRARDRKSNMRRFHEGLGHMKYDSIIDLIQRRYWWPKMKSEIKDYIARCSHCQLDQSNSGVAAPSIPRPIQPVALPFERWGVDFIQNLPETKNGNRHIITAIDYATRWVVAKAVKSMDADTVAEFLYEEILMNYGAPFEIITDRGSAFLSSALNQFEKLQQIKHIASTPYHPQTNGMVERMHSMLGHAITTLTEGKPARWDEYLKQSIFAIRVRTHAVTKKSPFYLLYGVLPRLPGDTDPPPSSLQPLDELERLEAEGEFFARTFEDLGMERRAAYERSKTQAELIRRRHDLKPDSPDYYFKIGDWVKMKHYAQNKFEFDWKGPYHVVDVGFPGTYWLMNPQGLRLDYTVNQNDLAPFLHRTEDNVSFFYDGTSRGGRIPEEGDSVITPPDSTLGANRNASQ